MTGNKVGLGLMRQRGLAQVEGFFIYPDAEYGHLETHWRKKLVTAPSYDQETKAVGRWGRVRGRLS